MARKMTAIEIDAYCSNCEFMELKDDNQLFCIKNGKIINDDDYCDQHQLYEGALSDYGYNAVATKQVSPVVGGRYRRITNPKLIEVLEIRTGDIGISEEQSDYVVYVELDKKGNMPESPTKQVILLENFNNYHFEEIL